jgi:cytoskeletal protein CcmA (bactofilin family)
LQHPQNKPTFIEKGVTLEGSVSFEGRLTIHGTVKGSLVGDHIVIAEEGVVMAETQASFMSIAGVFKGRLTVSGKMVLLPTGNCSGNIACREMELIAGGVLNGKIRCGQ